LRQVAGSGKHGVCKNAKSPMKHQKHGKKPRHFFQKKMLENQMFVRQLERPC
jgi:hypothetical protein